MEGHDVLVGSNHLSSLEEIRSKIESFYEDIRLSGWMELYQPDQNDSEKAKKEEELKHILERQDPLLKISFARFLSHIYEARAVTYLKKLLEDSNPVVVEAAKRSFEKNHYQQKLAVLLPLLNSSSFSAQLFALEQLSLGKVIQAVDPILDLLENLKGTENDENKTHLLLAILSALRHFPEKRLIPYLDLYRHDKREEVRFRTLLVMGALNAEGILSSSKPLQEALRDPSPRIRQGALWAVRRRPSIEDFDFLKKVSLEDEDPHVRQEALVELSVLPAQEVIVHLLQILATEKNRMVTLKCESVLLSMPTDRLIEGLEKILHEGRWGHDIIKNRALLLFAEFQKDSESYFYYLVEGLNQVPDVKSKLPFIEALGILENQRAIPILEKYLNGPSILAYATIQSILKIIRVYPQYPLHSYLEDPALPSLLKQMILKHIVRMEGTIPGTARLIDCLLGFLKDKTINIRYLAVQALLRTDFPFPLEKLVESIFQETDASTLKSLHEGLQRQVSKTPDTWLNLLRHFQKNQGIISYLFSMMPSHISFEEGEKYFFRSLLDSSQDLIPQEFKPVVVDFFCGLLIKKRISWKNLLECFEHHPQKSVWSEAIQSSLLELLGEAGQGSGIPFLVRILLNSHAVSFHSVARKSLHHILEVDS